MNATLPRPGSNYRYGCYSRYTPAHVRFYVKKKLIIYFNTLKPYREQLFLFLVKETNNRSCIVISREENLVYIPELLNLEEKNGHI